MRAPTLLITAAIAICGHSFATDTSAALLAPATKAAVWQGEISHAQIRMRMIQFADTAPADLFASRDGAVELNLFDDVSILATTDKLDIDDNGDFQWRGRMDNHGSYAVLTRRDGETAGIIRSPQGTFEIIPSGNGVSRVAEVNMAALAPCGVDPAEFAGNPLAGFDVDEVFQRTVQAEDQAAAAGSARGAIVPTLDQLVAYTPAALGTVGGTEAAMHAFIDNAIADMNAVFDNNGIAMQTRVVFKHPLSENELGNSASQDRDAFRINGDGKWDEIHQLRDDFGADVCHMLVQNGGGACGIASMIYRRNPGSDAFAFCVTDTGCVSGLTFVHEVGHLMGGAHDLVNAGGINGAGTFSYSFGWYDPDASPTWHSMMSYNPGGSNRIPYFSTPNINWSDGNPLGDAALADNSRTISLNIDLMTAWRGSVGLAPENVTSMVVPGQIALSWDAVAQATQYQIFRGATNNPATSSFRGVRATPAYTDSSVAPEVTYFYFIKAQFADGGLSPFSEPYMVTAAASNGADLSGDGIVNSSDLAILLAAWGTPAADLSGDGTTNSADLAILLAAWG